MKIRDYSLILLLALIFTGLNCSRDTNKDVASDESAVNALSETEITNLEDYLESVPNVEPTILSEKTALELVALPLSCVDKLHEKPSGREYLYSYNLTFISDYEDKRSFYGCSDWHSAVHSHWMLVKVAKMFPELSVVKLINEKLSNHLSEESLKGELEFFENEDNDSFERPYGYAWAMKLYEELNSWEDEEAKKWTENLKPLINLFEERSISYFNNRTFPMRNGTHSNTALAMSLMLDYAKSTESHELEKIIKDRASHFFQSDKNCSTWLEPSGSDFISPCLAQAKLMSKIMPTGEYMTWFESFMPSLYSEEFEPLTRAVEYEDKEQAKEELEGSVTHLDGLALYRGWAMNEISRVFAEDDMRRKVLQRLAVKQGEEGIKVIFDTDYAGTHWLGTYAFYYLLTNEQDA